VESLRVGEGVFAGGEVKGFEASELFRVWSERELMV